MNTIDKGTVFTLTHIDDMSTECLEHASDKKDYYDRVDLGNGKYKYFYSKESLRSYVNQAEAEQKGVKKGFGNKKMTENGLLIPILEEDMQFWLKEKKKTGIKKTVSKFINSFDRGTPEVFKKK